MAATLLKTSLLCVDFHPRNLLGVTCDGHGSVLITCKGVVKLFNVLDCRELRSWTTKSWNPFTAPAVCDPSSNKIVAVTNNSTLSKWNQDEDDVDKVKRIVFETSILQLLVCGDTVYVVFTSGQVENLNTALESRKKAKPGFLGEEESLSYVQIVKDAGLIVMLVKDKNRSHKLCVLQLQETVSSYCHSYSLSLENAHLTGVCALSSSKLITLWSTGRLHIFDLQNEHLEKPPGRQLAMETSIVTSKNTKILELSQSHIAIVGLDKGDEGGLLVLWDIKFAMVTSSRKLKMYQNPPLAWVSSEGIIVAEGGSLALIQYRVQESNLATMFGAKISEAKEFPSEVCHSWAKIKGIAHQDIVPKEATETICFNKNKELCQIIQELNKGSLSESILVADVVNRLIEKKRLLLLNETVTTFCDIPESCLIDVLDFYMHCKDMEFEGLCEYPHLQMEFEPMEEDADKIVCPFSAAKAHFINRVLKEPFTNAQLLIYLPRISFDHSLILIQYLNYLIVTGEAEVCPAEEVTVPTLYQVSTWLSLLLDTNYHQLVMTSQVNIHRLLLSCFTQVTNVLKFLEGVVDMEPLVDRIVKAKSLSKHTHTSAVYSLEHLSVV
ncbi:nucleolar protein 11 [Panulirus ornatus]|uniref:nucleolar protein 11 n=1 Tax=Panulirus ornatus TaxID=150431 RepID=UPI003A852E19